MNQLPISTSPLEQVTPNSLEDLFNKNPLDLTESEIMKMILSFRAERARWNEKEAAKPAKAKKSAAQGNLTLGDIEL